MPAKRVLSKERLDVRSLLLFEEHPQPMWIFDPQRPRILEANRAAAEMLGYAEEELRSSDLDLLMGPEEAGRFGELADGQGHAPPAAWRLRHKRGHFIDVEAVVHWIRFKGRKARLAVLVDATSRRRMEERLRQAQEVEAVGLLAGGVAHDFNNLLTIITGYSQLILNNLKADDPNVHSARQIMKAGEHAAALARQLLTFSRRQTRQPKVLDLNHLIAGLAPTLRRLVGDDVKLRVAPLPELGRVSADPGQLEQALMNLVVNARESMPRGGELTIETSHAELDDEYASRHIGVRPGTYVQLTVSDTGSGMDERAVAGIFDPPAARIPGNGVRLGLSTVFGVMRQSGGSVEVFSEPGKGAVVKCYLPCLQTAQPEEARQASGSTAPGGETVLLVESDGKARSMMREVLERGGYRIVDPAGPAEARRVAETHEPPIELLIADVASSKIEGCELAGLLTAVRPQLKVLYVSARDAAAPGSPRHVTRKAPVLQKPFTAAELLKKVREALTGPGGRSTSTGR
jgi:two-component system, cell cycle sensor histidine kinase and response regulator CckA